MATAAGRCVTAARTSGQHRGPMQRRAECLGISVVAHRIWRDRVDGPGQPVVVGGPVIDVDQVVETDPGQPLLATAQPAAKACGEIYASIDVRALQAVMVRVPAIVEGRHTTWTRLDVCRRRMSAG